MKSLQLKYNALLFALLSLFAYSGASAQDTTLVACPGVEYCIPLSNTRGVIQWESSADNSSWSDMTGETGATLCVTPSNGTTNPVYYRAKFSNTEPGCVDFFSAVVEFQLSDLTADAGSDYEVCEGTVVTLGGSPTGNGGAGGYVYNWVGLGSALSNPTTSADSTREYIVVVTDSDGCEAMDTTEVLANPNLTGSDTFNITGSVQYFVVPECRSNPSDSVMIECWGAEGRFGGSGAVIAPGGMGGYASGMLFIGNVDTLFVYVGGSVSAYNGGGNGGGGDCGGGRGGGASDVRVGGIALANRVIVAGGGGGGGCGAFVVGGIGGDGGGAVGSAGGATNSGTSGIIAQSQPGFPGTQVAGGVGGSGMVYCDSTGQAGSAGMLGIGGKGGDGVVGSNNSCSYFNIAGRGAGGGGGGYYGGGGGGGGVAVGEPGAGGGGGSSWVGGVSNGTTTSGVRTGEGMVVIHW